MTGVATTRGQVNEAVAELDHAGRADLGSAVKGLWAEVEGQREPVGAGAVIHVVVPVSRPGAGHGVMPAEEISAAVSAAVESLLEDRRVGNDESSQ